MIRTSRIIGLMNAKNVRPKEKNKSFKTQIIGKNKKGEERIENKFKSTTEQRVYMIKINGQALNIELK